MFLYIVQTFEYCYHVLVKGANVSAVVDNQKPRADKRYDPYE